MRKGEEAWNSRGVNFSVGSLRLLHSNIHAAASVATHSWDAQAPTYTSHYAERDEKENRFDWMK